GEPPPGPPGGPPTEMYAYDASRASRNPRSPALDPSLILGRARRVEGPGPPRLEALVPMSWTDGPCALVLIRRELGREPSVIPEIGLWLVPVAVTLAALLVAVGPIVARLRRLRDQVRRSARAGYGDAIALPGRDELAELAAAFDDAGRAIRGREE